MKVGAQSLEFLARGEKHEAREKIFLQVTAFASRLNIGAAEASMIIRLEGGAALSLRSKPFSLHLLNQSRAVHLEQLRRLARNPVGLSEGADD